MSDCGIRDESITETYLQIVRRLISDTSAAIEAVSRNALSDLELSLWNQEMSCATLKRLLARSTRMADADALCLRKELELLKALVCTYEQVMQRASASTALLVDVCSLRASISQRITHTSISCEA